MIGIRTKAFIVGVPSALLLSIQLSQVTVHFTYFAEQLSPYSALVTVGKIKTGHSQTKSRNNICDQ